MRQFRHVVKDRLLFGGSARWQKGVGRVGGPAAGKIVAIVGIVAAFHAKLVAVIEDGYSAYRKQAGESEFDARDRRLRLAHQPRDVVIPDDCPEQGRVWVEVIV